METPRAAASDVLTDTIRAAQVDALANSVIGSTTPGKGIFAGDFNIGEIDSPFFARLTLVEEPDLISWRDNGRGGKIADLGEPAFRSELPAEDAQLLRDLLGMLAEYFGTTDAVPPAGTMAHELSAVIDQGALALESLPDTQALDDAMVSK